MKELGVLIVLLVATALIVLVIHAYLIGAAQSHPTYIYLEEEPDPTPTYYDPTFNGWGYYPTGNYSGVSIQPVSTPIIAPRAGGLAKN